jgi:hypothetical protein
MRSNVRKILDTSQPCFKIVTLFLNIGKLKAGIGQLLPEVVVIYKGAAIASPIAQVGHLYRFASSRSTNSAIS